MATFDPFEKEFRRQAQGLRRSPSPRTWNRLEHRLDRGRGGARIFGIRPWMIAALFLIAAGVSVFASLAERQESVLAQRAQIIEELTAPYVPVEDFSPVIHENGVPALEAETVSLPHDFRDVVVAEKYRS
ncbi:MAG: hypothetical protein AAFN92_01160 [Bacteroidota bacterium]